MVKGFVRCGICDENFNSTEEWDEHAKGERHNKLVNLWRILELEARASNHHFLMKEEMINARKLVDEDKITNKEIAKRFKKVINKLVKQNLKESKSGKDV